MLLDTPSGIIHRLPAARRGHFSLSRSMKIALRVLSLMAPTLLLAETISGTIQDPSGAVITGARIEITGGDLVQPIVLSSDSVGKFASPELKAGMYSVRVL